MGRKSLLLVCLVLCAGAVTTARAAKPFQQEAGSEGLVSVEAEHFDKKVDTTANTWTLVTTATGFTAAEGFSGGEAMLIAPDTALGGKSTNSGYITGAPHLDFQVNFVKTGTHYVWILAFGRDGNADSAHAGLDGLAIDTCDRMSGWNGRYSWSNSTMDNAPSTFDVPSGGVHTLNIYMREDGLVFDKIVLTTNPNCTPTGHGPAESARGIPDWATAPDPGDSTTDVPREVTLAWASGPFAATHDVYFGTDQTKVAAASRTDPLGVLIRQAQDANTYVPAARLEFGQTYYWRVDEVNAPPDATVIKGNVWSFTTEPVVYRMQNIVATASSSGAGVAPAHTINGSGLNASDQHSTAETAMWVSDKAGPQPTWIQYEFDGVYKLSSLWVWNYNHTFESVLGFGFKDVTIEYSINGTDWTVLGDVQFAQGPAQEGYVHNPPVDLQGVAARFIRLTAKSNFSGMAQFGLSEVRFFYIPAQPREPQPTDGATGVAVDATLSWRAGREAATHQVCFGTDPNAVANGTALTATVNERSYDPGPLELGKTYFWQVTEVNEAATPSSWTGEVWSFATKEYVILDDFESYTDVEGSRIFDAWIDGWASGTSGSTVGYVNPPFAEQKIVHGGKQAMPLDYNNINSPWYSEAERTWDTPQDWTVHGMDSLVLYFRGYRLGFVQDAAGNITMSGAGTDIYNAADEFRFAAKKLSGNGTIIARVESVDNIEPWTKAGVMIRESLDPGSRFAAVYATPGNGVRYQARLLTAGNATSDTPVATAEQTALRAPVWVKLERSGTSFSGFYSTDGAKWTSMSWNPQTINMMAGTVYIGLAVTSHLAGTTATAKFSNIAITGGSGSWEEAALGVAQPANGPGQLYVVVEDKAGHVAVVNHSDPQAVQLDTWQRWSIPLMDLSGAGVNLAAVRTMYLGVGDRNNPAPGGAGKLFIDDIAVGHPAAGGSQ